jgi:Predicted membrane protein
VADAFAIGRGQELIARALQTLDLATPSKLTTVGLAAICYGVLFGVEGTGLWLQRRWAEYLTVVTTGALVPFELYELAHRLTVLRSLALAVNLAAVVYLIFRLRHPPNHRH